MNLKNKILFVFLVILFHKYAFADMLIDKWIYYKKNFISEDGRVIDFQNNSITHSEAQGYGMLLSVLFDDKETFEKLWNWTKFNLQKRKGDNLLSWSWGKHISDKWTVLDYNNATDGDTLVAYALCLAGEKWRKEEFINEAKAIINDIKEFLIIKRDIYQYLLPGYFGFQKGESLILNPSYYILPAYKAFASVSDKDFWENFYSESIKFLEKVSFGQYGLPADWIVIQNKNIITLPDDRENIFGFEAIRIPLYAVMAKENKILEKFRNFLELTEKINYIPKDINLKDGRISSQDAMAMHYLIFSHLAKKIGKTQIWEKLKDKGFKKMQEEKNYYSFTLSLLILKWEER